MENFVHLNVKSEYSLLNSIAKTKEIIQKVKNSGMGSIAITDLNNMYDVYHFGQACEKENIHHIIGVSFCIYFENLHSYGNIELLAMNEKGYKNLVCLSTLANKGEEHTGKDGFAYLPFSILKKYSEGLICLSGGTSSIFYQYYYQNPITWDLLIKDFLMIYGENFYYEFQNHGNPTEVKMLEDKKLQQALWNYNIPVVATNDVYYVEKEHAPYRDLALEMNPNKNGLDIYSHSVQYNDEWYLKTPEEMFDLFKDSLALYPQILSNTVEIAKKCQAKVPVEKALPEFPIPSGYTNESYLRMLCEEGFKERFDGRLTPEEMKEYHNRLDYEFDVIKKMGFIDYHIITADFIQWAKDDKVFEHPERYFPVEYYPDYGKIPEKLWKKDYEILVGPGRGSAAGSLLCYCLKITNLDPIKDGLLFERFLNVERVSMPDIDIDFPNKYRYDVVEYVQGKYGYEKVSQIATFQTLGVKSIIKSVGKTLGFTFQETNEMTKNIPNKEMVQEEDEDGNVVQVEKKIELLSQLEKYEYFRQKIDEDGRMKELFQIGKILEGLPSSTGKHAAGVIIGRKDLMNYMPLMEVDGVMVSQFEKKASESIGMLKMDVRIVR